MLKQVFLFVPGNAGKMFSARAMDKDKTKQNKAQIYKEVELNKDGCFDKDTGVFTAPVAGAYVFSARVSSDEQQNEVCSHIMIGDSSHTIIQGGWFRDSKSVCVLVQLERGKEVWMKPGSPADKYDAAMSWNCFYCTLVHAQP